MDTIITKNDTLIVSVQAIADSVKVLTQNFEIQMYATVIAIAALVVFKLVFRKVR